MCVVWTWIKNIVCVAWVYLTAAICLIPGIGNSSQDSLDGVIDTILDVVGGVIGGIIGFISHPVEAIKTIISLFGGCPKVRALEPGPLQVIAHHGSALEFPEALPVMWTDGTALGANALEIDICMTADEQLILWHDWDPDDLIFLTRQVEIAQIDNAFNPMPKLDNEWRKPSIELTLAEFRSHFSYQDERDGTAKIKWEVDHGPIDLTIPTLPEFFAAALGGRHFRTVYIDVKMPATAALRYAGPMADQIHALLVGMREPRFNVIVMVPDSLVLQAMKAHTDRTNIARLYLGRGISRWSNTQPAQVWRIDHATNSLFHNAAASVGRPVAALFPWRVYRRTIGYDIGRWNDVNANPTARDEVLSHDAVVGS